MIPADAWPIVGLVEWAGTAHRSVTDFGLGNYEVVRATPWSTVVCWQIEDHRVWGKATCPGFAAECRLLPLLAERCPGHVLAPIAVEPDQGWLLLPDGGPTMQGVAGVASWTQTLLEYAELQRSVDEMAAELLEIGCPDMRPHAAVERLAQMMLDGHVAEHRWLIDAAGEVAIKLDTGLVPSTIQHDDLRPDNVFSDGRVFDWGDASVAHPFASLLTALMPERPDRPGTPKEQSLMRDTYLRSWQQPRGGEPSDLTLPFLREQARLACLLAPVGRIDTWLRAPDRALELYPEAVDRWVKHMLASDWS